MDSIRKIIPVLVGLAVALLFGAVMLGDQRDQNLDQIKLNLVSKMNEPAQAFEAQLREEFALLEGIKPQCGADKNAQELALIPALEAARVRSRFVTLLVADAQGEVLAGAPMTGRNGTAYYWRKALVSDREYWIVPMATKSKYISSAFEGRGFGRDWLVALSVPFFCDNKVAGVVEGSMLLSVLSELLSEKDWPAEVLVFDQLDQVLFHTAKPGLLTAKSIGDLPIAIDHVMSEAGRLFETRLGHDATIRFAAKTKLLGQWNLVSLDQERAENLHTSASHVLALLVAMVFGVAAFFIAREFAVARTADAGPMQNDD